MCPFGINKLTKTHLKTLNSAQKLCMIETGLSNFRKMNAILMRMNYKWINL